MPASELQKKLLLISFFVVVTRAQGNSNFLVGFLNSREYCNFLVGFYETLGNTNFLVGLCVTHREIDSQTNTMIWANIIPNKHLSCSSIFQDMG